MIFHSGRSVARLRVQCLGSCRTLVTFSSAERAPALYKLNSPSNKTAISARPDFLSTVIRRAYADRPVSRPKAHTGRTTTAARRAPTTSATKAAKKPAPKKTTPKAIPKGRSTANAKSKSKSKSKSKPKKAKAKPKRKPTKKVLSDKQKAAKTLRDQRTKTKELKEVALLDSPKATPSTAWTVFITERNKTRSKDTKTTEVFKEATGPFRNLTPEQLEVSSEMSMQIIFVDVNTALQSHCESEQGRAPKCADKMDRVSHPSANS